MYWYLNHGGSELSALSQQGFGYVDDKDYGGTAAITHEEQNDLYISSRQGSSKSYIKDDSYNEKIKGTGHRGYKDSLRGDVSSNYAYDTDDDESHVDESAPERLCNPPDNIKATEESG